MKHLQLCIQKLQNEYIESTLNKEFAILHYFSLIQLCQAILKINYEKTTEINEQYINTLWIKYNEARINKDNKKIHQYRTLLEAETIKTTQIINQLYEEWKDINEEDEIKQLYHPKRIGYCSFED